LKDVFEGFMNAHPDLKQVVLDAAKQRIKEINSV